MTVRYRITYSKTVPLRYTGTLDMQRSWERTIRRARLPISYSQGYHPQPRIQQALPLPLGFTSCCEMIDIWLEAEFTDEDIQQILTLVAPPGVESIRVYQVDLKAPPLQTQITSADYEITLLEPVNRDQVLEKIEEIRISGTLIRRWKEKDYDLRPLIEELSLLDGPASSPPTRLRMRLAAREAATGRPEEVLSALGINPLTARVERTALIFVDPSGNPVA